MTAKDNIVLIGMPASGKSTVGVILAKVLGMDFLDVDLLIQNRMGRKLSQLIEERGNSGFLALEEEINAGVDVHRTVISPGGSVIYGPKAMEHYRQIATVIYLKVPCDNLVRRLHSLHERGVVLKKGQTLQMLFNEREPLYERYADLTITEQDESIEHTVTAILEQLQGRQN